MRGHTVSVQSVGVLFQASCTCGWRGHARSKREVAAQSDVVGHMQSQERELRAATSLTRLARVTGYIERMHNMFPLALGTNEMQAALEDLDDVRNYIASTLR